MDRVEKIMILSLLQHIHVSLIFILNLNEFEI